MKRFFSVLAGLFLILFLNSFCFSAEVSKDAGFSGKLENGVRVIEVKASKYKFEPDPIIVKFGEKVRLVAVSTDVTHGLAIGEFGINLKLPVGKPQSVEFIADKKGKFKVYCSVFCGAGHSHMQGSFIVKEQT